MTDPGGNGSPVNPASSGPQRAASLRRVGRVVGSPPAGRIIRTQPADQPVVVEDTKVGGAGDDVGGVDGVDEEPVGVDRVVGVVAVVDVGGGVEPAGLADQVLGFQPVHAQLARAGRRQPSGRVGPPAGAASLADGGRGGGHGDLVGEVHGGGDHGWGT